MISASNEQLQQEIIKLGQSSHKMYCNNLLNFQESTTILNACTKKKKKKKSGNLANNHKQEFSIFQILDMRI